MPDKLSKPGEEHRDPSNKGVKKNRDKLGGLLVETQIVTEKTDTEPVKDVVFLTKKYQKQLVAVRAKLKSLGWEPRSPEDTVSTQRKKEDKFLTNIKEIETGLGVKLSEESLRLARKKFEEDVQSDVQAYLAKFDSLLSQEKELVESIEDLGPDVSRAEEYWKQALDGETRIEAPMDPNCEISIVVPAFNEDPERVMRQIESLKKQKDITHGLFEVIYVVNNDVASDSESSRATVAMNARLMDFLRQDHGIRIHVIDKSSPGNEIVGCNVGKARNRGVAESSVRFQELGRNGILIQTDADTWFEDEQFLSKVKTMLGSDPEVIGVAGGLNLEWDPETKDPKERAVLRKKVDRLLLRETTKRLVEFFSAPNKYGRTSFMGADMISRSFESAVIGGVPKIKGGEDGAFGSRLESYGRRKGKIVVGAKHELFVTTSFRESDRTGSSLKKIFDSINPDIPEMVPNVFALTDREEPKEVELNSTYVDRLKVAIREKEGGNEYVDDFEKSMTYIRLKQE